MHGFVVEAFRDYVRTRHGGAAWEAVVAQGDIVVSEGLPNLDRVYPDQVLLSAIGHASRATGMPMPALLEDFGAFLGPILVRTYRDQVNADWRTLDVIEHTETRIHSVVRRRDPDAAPPALQTTRRSSSEVLIEYTSARRLCYLAEGIARGLADHFNELVDVTQTECMHRGDTRCLISVSLSATSRPG